MGPTLVDQARHRLFSYVPRRTCSYTSSFMVEPVRTAAGQGSFGKRSGHLIRDRWPDLLVYGGNRVPASRQPAKPAAQWCSARCCQPREQLRSGDVLTIGRSASVQFAGDRGFTFRLTAVDQQPTAHGWVWLTGYVLDKRGKAVAKREIFVQLSGLKNAGAAVPTNRWARLPARTDSCR